MENALKFIWITLLLGLGVIGSPIPFVQAEVHPGEEAPHFTLKSLDGALVETEGFIGKQPTLLMFWASW